MDMTRLKQLAGVSSASYAHRAEYSTLMEVVQLADDLSMDELIRRLDACRRALGIVNGMTDPADRKKWLSAVFVNLNKVRGALTRLMSKEGLPADGYPTDRPARPREQPQLRSPEVPSQPAGMAA